jgi:hypothetical protein
LVVEDFGREALDKRAQGEKRNRQEAKSCGVSLSAAFAAFS